MHDLTCVLVYPNTRDVAFASLGFLKVLDRVRARLKLADLSYLPESDTDEILSKRQHILLGADSRNEVKAFDIVAFSISYENDFVHVPELLLRANVAPLARDRSDTWPLVISGGFTMASNPLPVADFFDAVVVGEAEPVIDTLLEAITKAKARDCSKPELLARLAEVEGIYVPALGEHPVKRVWAETAEIADEPFSGVPSHFKDMFLIEVGRGCSRGCLFCAAGNLYRPVRMRSRTTILDRLKQVKRVGLVGTAVGDHPDLVTIVRKLVGSGREVGISSLRADQITQEVANLLARGGIQTVAIAPEAGSETLRARLNKGITTQQVSKAVEILSQAGIANIKLYFMVGLPAEKDEDIEAIISLVNDLALRRGKSRLEVAVSPFVPKPHTAFQWAGFARRDTLKARLKILRCIRRIRGCSLKVASADEAWTEAVLARGDRSLSLALLQAITKGVPLRQILRRNRALDPTRELDTRKPLPWDFIDQNVPKKRLVAQYQRAMAA